MPSTEFANARVCSDLADGRKSSLTLASRIFKVAPTSEAFLYRVYWGWVHGNGFFFYRASTFVGSRLTGQ